LPFRAYPDGPASGILIAVTAHGRVLLGPGSTGEHVRHVQDRLLQLGYANAPPVDEYVESRYGPWTEQAVAAFQAAYGMRTSGQIDEATWTMMFAPPDTPVPTADRLIQLCLQEVDDGLSDHETALFDCAELISWACAQMGIVSVPSRSTTLWDWCAQTGLGLSVASGAHIRGALLYRVAGGERPAQVALSLGTGHDTIEAIGAGYGVRVGYRAENRFDYAALLPGIEYPRD
jgi:hypothetical protein